MEKEQIILERLDEFETKLDRVLFYIENDKRTGKVGLVQEMENVKTTMNGFIAKSKQQDAFKKGIIAFAGAVGGLLVLLIEAFIALLSKK